jgi:RAQPRD family integrative conjugative element protein
VRVRSRVSAVVGVLAGILLISPATADSDAERGALARLIRELEALEPLIDEAERHADRYTRARFAYDWLRGDLERMKAGIRAHLERPRTEPNEDAPVVGEEVR